MKTLTFSVTVAIASALAPASFAHLIGDPAHDGKASGYDFGVSPPVTIVLAQADLRSRPKVSAATNGSVNSLAARIAAAFAPFAPKVKTRADEKYFFVESDGIPAHNMMVGITAWQQQVPLPQPYSGHNAWRFPLAPVPAAQPQSIKNHFLRGAIALAVNGIPIFNPQNNRGEVSAEIGELDQWGGHCGRADDYHYHAAPLHLQSVVGMALPIAYALDGYALYGLTEPDGSAPTGLDSFNGHSTTALGYHYHASTKYPYINGGFHGEVVEAGGQVDPQPQAQGVREALQALRGASITGFTIKDPKTRSLKYEIGNETRYVNYVLGDNGTVKFDFVDGRGQVRSQIYSPRQRGPDGGGGAGDRPPGGARRGGNREGDIPRTRSDERPARNEAVSSAMPLILQPKHSGKFVLTSSAVKDRGGLSPEFNGDGAGVSPPLEWKGAPAGTISFALVMDHLAPDNVMKCYWTMWSIPNTVTNLPTNVRGVGEVGASFRGRLGYEPPHSQGPGLKTYTIHVYALSESPRLTQNAREVTREVLLATIKDSILDSAELKVTYTRPATAGGEAEPPRRPRGSNQ